MKLFTISFLNYVITYLIHTCKASVIVYHFAGEFYKQFPSETKDCSNNVHFIAREIDL